MVTLKETKKKARRILDSAQKQATAMRQGVVKRERQLDKKLETINKILPMGFTPAPNPALLPESIQRRINAPAQEVLDAFSGAGNFIATPAQRQLVYDYAKFGVPLTDIRLRVVNQSTGKPVDMDTMKRHFHEEISLGLADGNTAIATSAFRMATHQPAEYDDDGKETKPEIAPNPSVLIASAKHRLKWFENKNVIHTHNMGVEPELAEALKELSPDELRTLRRIAERRASEKADNPDRG